jgi:arylsulfatase
VSGAPGTDAAGASGRWDRADSALCAGLLLAFVATRVLWLRLAPASSHYWEEGYRWIAVDAIVSGAPVPLLDWQADHYQGSSLVVIALAAGLAALGVAPLAALKAVSLVFSGATLAALYAVGRRFFGRSAGFLAALAYLAGPPLVAFWGVVAMGFHAESTLLTLIGVGWLLALADAPSRSLRACLGLGVLSGLAIWFSPTAALGVAACVVVWPLLAGRPRPQELAAAAAGLALGLAPWLAYNAARGFGGVRRLSEVFGLAAASDPFRSQGVGARALDLLWRGPSEGLLDPGGDATGSAWLALATAGVGVPAGLALLAACRRGIHAMRASAAAGDARAARRELPFLVYGALFAAAYLASRFTLPVDPTPIGFRLLVPPAVLLLVPVAVSAARALAPGEPRRGAARAACAIALVSLAGTTLAFAHQHREPGTPLDWERAHKSWGHILQRKSGADVAGVVASLAWLPPERREGVLVGIGWGLQAAFEQGGDVEELARLLAPLEPRDRAAVMRGIAYWTGLARAALAGSAARPEDPDRRRVEARLGALAAWSQPPSLVLVTLDTTRVDHLSCYGYERVTSPALDALAARGVVFDRAWSTSSWTLPAHASLFTGLYPSRHGADYDPRGGAVLGDVVGLPVAKLMRAGKLADDAVTLAELLAARGYATGAFVAGPWLHRSFGLLQGFAHKDDDVHTFGGRPAAEITANALAWLRERPPGEPYFLFANYFDPHAPYEPVGRYPDLPRAGEPLEYDYESLMREGKSLDADARAVLRDRYDAEIRDMDRQLGILLEAVRARPEGERTLIVVTSDHGEALGEDGRLGHGFWLSEELTRVPLVVRYPGDRDAGTRRADPIQLVDVIGLVARELELPLPERAETLAPGARSAAFLELRREPTTAVRFGAQYDRDLQAAVLWPHKLTRSDDGGEALARLAEGALTESPAPDPAEALALRELLDAHVRAGPPAPRVAPETDPATVEALRALGYVE